MDRKKGSTISKNAVGMRVLRKDSAYRERDNQRKQTARASRKKKKKKKMEEAKGRALSRISNAIILSESTQNIVENCRNQLQN